MGKGGFAFRDKEGIQQERDRNRLRMATVARHAPDGPAKEAKLDQLEAKGSELYKVERMLDGGYDPSYQYGHN
jgi:hypothetical protein